jgi:hypothetical protein
MAAILEFTNHLQRRRLIRELSSKPATPEIVAQIKALMFKRNCAYKNCNRSFTTEYENKIYCSPACRNCANVMRNYEKSKLKGKSHEEVRPQATGTNQR